MRRSIVRIATSREVLRGTKTGQITFLKNAADVIPAATLRPSPQQRTARRHFLFKHTQSPAIENNATPKETSESKLFKMGSTLASRMTTDRKIQCTEVDSKGDVMVDHKEIKRSELVSKASRLLLSRQE